MLHKLNPYITALLISVQTKIKGFGNGFWEGWEGPFLKQKKLNVKYKGG